MSDFFANFRPPVAHYEKLPGHLAFAFPHDKVPVDMLADLVFSTAAVGIPELSFFDAGGVCQRHRERLSVALSERGRGQPAILMRTRVAANHVELVLIDKGKISTHHSISGSLPNRLRLPSRPHSLLLVNLLADHNAMAEIIQTIKNIAKQDNTTTASSSPSSTSSSSSPSSIESVLQSGHSLRLLTQIGTTTTNSTHISTNPTPSFSLQSPYFISESDLLISLSPCLTVCGFPPWLLRVAEIFFASEADIRKDNFMHGMIRKYEKTVQRGGT